MNSLAAAGAGFLLAVLWFDLMFDVQVRGQADGELPEPVLASIAQYYRRVTTEARPMNRLVAVAMLATLVGIVVQALQDNVPRGVTAASAVAAVVPIGLAAIRTVPSAVRLGARRDALAAQSTLARSVCRDHLFCVASIATLLIIQLIWT